MRWALEERARRLLEENAGRWLENFAGGLLERLEVQWGTLEQWGEVLLAAADLRGLWVRGAGAEWVAALSACPWLARLASLDLSHNEIGAAGAATLAASPHLAALASLDLSDNGIGDAGAAALAGSPHLATLASAPLAPSSWPSAKATVLFPSPGARPSAPPVSALPRGPCPSVRRRTCWPRQP